MFLFRSRLLLQPLLLASLLCHPACGSSDSPGGGDSGQFPVRTAQSALTQDAWQALVDADAALKTLATAQTQAWQTAGQIVAADGRTLVWAEFAPSADAPRTEVSAIFSSCAKAEGATPPSCVRGKASYTATGATFSDEAGKALDAVPMGAPQPWEWETSTNLDNDNSTIVAGLSGDAPPVNPTQALAQFAAIAQQKRRFIVLSSYGRQMGVDVSDIAGSA